MEFITVKRIMDRLMVNPNFRKLQYSQAATYLKDFCSINNVGIIPKKGFSYVEIKNYKGEIDPSVMEVKRVYVCKFVEEGITYQMDPENPDNDTLRPHPSVYKDGALLHALDESIMRDGYKTLFGEWNVEGNILFTDIEEGVVEIYAEYIRTDDLGFPVLPYHGSLMQAAEEYVKAQYYRVLYESNVVPKEFSVHAEQQYCWYIAQYSSLVDIPSEDEGISIANSWQRLVHSRNRNARGGSFPQFMVTK